MKISSAQLKSVLKKLDPVGSEHVWLDTAVGFVAAQDANLQITATEKFLQALESEQARICVNRRQLAAVCGRKEELDLRFSGTTLHVSNSRTKFELVGAPHEMTVPPSPPSSFDLPGELLRQMVSYAASAAERKQQYLYTGTVQLAIDGPKITVAGSDGQRLALTESTLSSQSTALCSSLPLALVSAIQKLESDVIWLGETDQASYAATRDSDSSVTAVARKVASSWPDYRKFIPESYSLVVEIDATALADALDEVSPMAGGENPRTGLVTPAVGILFDDGRLVLTATGSGKAETALEYDQIAPDSIFGGPLRSSITINHRFLAEFLDGIKGVVQWRMNGPEQPVWLEAGARKLLVAPIKKGRK